MIKRLLSWSNYLYIGMAIAVLLSLLDKPRDGFYQLIPIIIFLVLSGVKDNINNLKTFICNYPIFGIAVAVWTIYFSINKTLVISNRYAITAFLVIFAGFCVSQSGDDNIKSAMNKLWLLLFALETIGVVKYLAIHNFSGRMYLFFMNPIAEGDAAIVLTLVSLLYIENIKKRVMGVALSFAVVITGSLRLALCILMLILIVYSICKRKSISDMLNGRLKRIRGTQYSFFIAIVALAILSSIMVIFKKSDIRLFDMLYRRYVNAFSSLTKDVYINLFGDYSYKIRIIAVDQAIDVFRQGGKLERIFGHGMLSGYYAIKPIMTFLIKAEADAAGPIENTFISLLSDYGALAFVLYFGVYVSAIVSFIKTHISSVRVSSVFALIIMTLSAFIDMEYWINLAFFLWIFIGIYLGSLVNEKEKAALLPALIFSTVIAANLYFLPRGYSAFRTGMNSLMFFVGKSGTIVIMIIAIVTYFVFLWSICVFISNGVQHSKNGKKRYAIVTVSTGIVLTIVAVSIKCSMSKIYPTIRERVEAESEIIKIIEDSSTGTLYNDTFPSIYNDVFISIQGTFFSAASMTAKENITAIVSREEEQYIMSCSGFLYLPISEWDAIYTNDTGVITALTKHGYNLTGYNTDIRGTEYIKSIELKDGSESKIYKPIYKTEVYPGKYTATFKLKMEYDETRQNRQVCTLIVSSLNVEKPFAEIPILSSDFDNNGRIESLVPFSTGSKDCYFAVSMDGEDDVSVESITYTRTP